MAHGAADHRLRGAIDVFRVDASGKLLELHVRYDPPFNGTGDRSESEYFAASTLELGHNYLPITIISLIFVAPAPRTLASKFPRSAAFTDDLKQRQHDYVAVLATISSTSRRIVDAAAKKELQAVQGGVEKLQEASSEESRIVNQLNHDCQGGP
jgi:hypothetical protein